jgi:hypothetical protein
VLKYKYGETKVVVKGGGFAASDKPIEQGG